MLRTSKSFSESNTSALVCSAQGIASHLWYLCRKTWYLMIISRSHHTHLHWSVNMSMLVFCYSTVALVLPVSGVV